MRTVNLRVVEELCRVYRLRKGHTGTADARAQGIVPVDRDRICGALESLTAACRSMAGIIGEPDQVLERFGIIDREETPCPDP